MFGKKSTGRSVRGGRQSASPYAYYSSRDIRQDSQVRQSNSSTRNQKTRSLKWWHHLPSIVSGLVILCCLIYALGLNSNPIVVQLTHGKNTLQSKNAYEQASRQLFKKSFFNTNKITVNVSGITHELKQRFPELSDVTITIPIISHSPIVYITPSQPALILKATNGNFVLSEAGTAVIKAEKIKNLSTLQLPIIEDHTNLKVELGKVNLPASQAKFISTTYNQLLAQKQAPKAFTLPPIANELDITPSGANYYVKMDMQADAKEQVGTMLATIGYLKAKSISPSSYMDVRVSGRAYYK